MKYWLLSNREFYKYSKYNLFINIKTHTIIDGRLSLWDILFKKYNTHTYIIWTLYTNKRWSNDVLDTMLHDVPLILS